MKPQFVLLANLENRRAVFFQQALQRAGLPAAIEISYRQLLTGEVELGDYLSAATCLRIESPGEDWEVEKQLLQLGAERAEQECGPFLTAPQAALLEFDLGRVLFPRQWYLGYVVLLERIEQAITESGASWMNHPSDIATMFDKQACCGLFQNAGLPIPAPLPPVGCYDELIEAMEAAGQSQVFVKLAHGSSASGVVAFRRKGNLQEAITSAELVSQDGELRVYNSLKLRRYRSNEDLRSLFDFLTVHRVHAESWLPKAVQDNEMFDLRIVVAGGVARQAVMRQSRSPLTNLHLGNQRGDLARLQSNLDATVWPQIEQLAVAVDACFPKSVYAGIDLMIAPNFHDLAVLEANAFGDLLPRIEHNGEDTYGSELRVCLEYPLRHS